MTDSLKQLIERLIRPEVRALKAYHVPDATGLIKLDAMENPYTWPQAIKREWCEALSAVALNRYPDSAARTLTTTLRAAMGIPAGAEVLLGNGSDELIQLILLSVAQDGAVVLAPTPTFVMYELVGVATGVKFVGVPLSEDFEIDLPAMRAALQQHRPAVVFVSYPNNPTGNLFSPAAIDTIVREAPGLVVIDEAYYPFAGTTLIDRLGRHDNLLVMRTVSKLGLAGLRLGMLVGAAPWLAEFDKLRLPYNINSLTQASVEFILGRREVLDAQIERICTDRDGLFEELAAIPGIRAWPSRANFILFRSERKPAKEVFDRLRTGGVLVKNLDAQGGALRDCLRVTVGAPAENAAFLDVLRRSA